jgi:hypothetical protein
MSQPYGIYVNPYTGYIYGTDAGAFDGAGYLYQWTPEGKLLGKYKVYINPAHFLALPPEGYWSSIESIHDSQSIIHNREEVIYDIMGRRIDNSQFSILNSQLYIRGGKKILYTK